MLRVGFLAGICSTVLLAGCAADSQPEASLRRPAVASQGKLAAPIREKVVVRTRTCTTTILIGDVCSVRKACEAMTCSEAYYRWMMCGDSTLVAGDSGIPCETRCGRTTREMSAAILAAPFLLPRTSHTACTPAT